MLDETIPRQRPERTGKHLCASCLQEISADEYLGGDFYCRKCAAKSDHYPLATTPNARPKKREKK